MRWQGQRHGLRFGPVELELADDIGNSIRWPAVVAFATPNLRYPLLGIAGCLQFLDVRFLGEAQVIEVETNASLP
jgi:hypothetical protein